MEKSVVLCLLVSLVSCTVKARYGDVTLPEKSDIQIGDTLKKALGYSKNLISYRIPPSLNGTPCGSQMSYILREANELNLWALKILDASAKLPSGILSGNLNQYGDFDECLSAEGNHKSTRIKGKYCLATIDLRLSGNVTDRKLKALDNLIHSHRMFKNELTNPGHRIPKFETFNWGICIPSACSADEIKTALEYNLHFAPIENVYRLNIQVDDETCYINEAKEFSLVKWLIKCLFVLVLMATILEFFTDVDTIARGNVKTAMMLKCFSLKRNWKSFVDTKPANDDDIECLHGGRFLNAVALLLSHKQIAMLYNPLSNRTATAESFDRAWTMVGRSAILYTDSFIMLSGLLASYVLVKDLDNGKGIQFKNKLINRITRFTPNLMGVILFCTYVLVDASSGPQWGLVVDKYANLCRKYMWRNFLYIHNYFGFENMCLTHTHQVGIDMQLFLVSPIFIYVMWKFPKMGTIVLLAFSGASTWLRYQVTREQELSTLIYYGISVERMWKTASLSYILPTHRLTVYLSGVMLGYYLRRNGRSLRFNRITATIGWIAAVSLALTAMFGYYEGSYMGYEYKPNDSAWINAFGPILWVGFVGWVVLACTNGYGGFFNTFLSWKYFRIFTRISYAVYLTQFPVFFYGIGVQRTVQFYKGFHSLFDIAEILTILLVSVILTLTLDMPFQTLKKTFYNYSEIAHVKKNESPVSTESSDEKFRHSTVIRRVQQFGT